MTTDIEHTEIRRELMESFCLLPREGDALTWQRKLADAIIASESDKSGKNWPTEKEHRHLLRVIGDCLVRSLIPTHTIRALSNHPGQPASIASQGGDFDFVLSTAKRLTEQGFIPIISDLTTLLGIGDLVCCNSQQIVVFECKNRLEPQRPAGGRLARQRERGEQLETYLRTSQVTTKSGDLKIATPASLPQPDWQVVNTLLDDCQNSTEGFAIATLGPSDHLFSFDYRLEHPQVLWDSIPDASGLKLPAVALYSELIDESTHLNLSPPTYPLPAKLRLALLEREIFRGRAVDMSLLNDTVQCETTSLDLVTSRMPDGFDVQIRNKFLGDLSFTPSLVEYCLWTPVPVAAMRKFLSDYAFGIVARLSKHNANNSAMPVADGDEVIYATVYRDVISTKSL